MGISNELKLNNVIGKNITGTAVNSALGHAITKTSFNIEDMAAQMAGGVITDFSSSLVEPKYIPTEEPLSEALDEAERVASMPILDAELNFQTITCDDSSH